MVWITADCVDGAFRSKDGWEIRLDEAQHECKYCVWISAAFSLWKKSGRPELQFRI